MLISAIQYMLYNYLHDDTWVSKVMQTNISESAQLAMQKKAQIYSSSSNLVLPPL